MQMSLIHTVESRNALCEAIRTRAAAGTTNPTPAVVLMTSTDVTVATLNMSTTPYQVPAAGAMTANVITSDTNVAGGLVARFKVVNRDGAEVYRGTVTDDQAVTPADMELSSLNYAAGDTASLSSLIYNASV